MQGVIETGWLLQDAGDLDAAAGRSRRAAEWAHCAGDTRMAAYMLIRQANIAILTDDHAAVIQLATAARRAPGPTEPKLTTLALQQQARGHALGEFRICFSLPDQAAKTSATTPPSATPPHRFTSTITTPARWKNRPLAATATLGALTAVTILENTITATAGNETRDHSNLTAKLAVTITRASQPGPGRAARLGMDALARDTGSARITRQLLGRCPGHSAPRDFTQALATA